MSFEKKKYSPEKMKDETKLSMFKLIFIPLNRLTLQYDYYNIKYVYVVLSCIYTFMYFNI